MTKTTNKSPQKRDKPKQQSRILPSERMVYIASGFGVAFILMLLLIAVFCPNPTSFQCLVFRVVLALAAAGVAAMISGFLTVHVGTVIKASGAIAVFVIIYFFNPAALVVNPEAGPPTPKKTVTSVQKTIRK